MTLPPDTPARRVQWAIERSGRSLKDIGDAIGCSHAALSQWATGSTDLANAKTRLVLAFAQEMGINVQWPLTGEGPAVSSYGHSSALELLARELTATDPLAAATAERVLRALMPAEDKPTKG